MNFYRMVDDVDIANRWFLGDINFNNEDDVWKFISAKEIYDAQLNLEAIQLSGNVPLDLTMADFEILIASEMVSDVFRETEVQKIPIKVKGVQSRKYFILVIKREVDCIDKSKSKFTIWQKDNPIRPDLAGSYQNFSKIVVDPATLKGINICRIKDFNVAIIVSDVIKEIFEENNFRGVKFKKV